MKRLLVTCLLCLFCTVEAQPAQGPPVPTDFNFVLQYGTSAQLVLDTLKGTFTRDADIPKLTLTISLKLKPTEIDEIFRDLARIDFWNDTKYPHTFSPPRGNGRMVVPCGFYSFSVMSNGQMKEFVWERACFYNYAPANELSAVFEKIHRFVELKPEYRALPRSQAPTRI